jgi:hypothetical protein
MIFYAPRRFHDRQKDGGQLALDAFYRGWKVFLCALFWLIGLLSY